MPSIAWIKITNMLYWCGSTFCVLFSKAPMPKIISHLPIWLASCPFGVLHPNLHSIIFMNIQFSTLIQSANSMDLQKTKSNRYAKNMKWITMKWNDGMTVIYIKINTCIIQTPSSKRLLSAISSDIGTKQKRRRQGVAQYPKSAMLKHLHRDRGLVMHYTKRARRRASLRRRRAASFCLRLRMMLGFS